MPAEQRSIGFSEVQHALIKGGYFRARIQALPAFDVVAGGLAWCIQHSRFTIDVDFVENAEIRHKLKVAENICSALHDRMHCPHPLEPHQIQGLDYPKIFVVLKWLMKRVAATRDENAFFVKQFTNQDFLRRFRCTLPGRRTVKATKPKPAPQRVMVSGKQEYSSAVEHATAVLLEYGMQAQVKDSVLMMRLNAADLEGDAEAQQEHQKIEEEEKKEAAMMEALMSQMQQHKEKAKMSASSVNNVLATADSNKLAKLRDAYQQRHELLQEQLRQEEEERNELAHQKERAIEIRESIGGLEAQAEALTAANQEIRDKLEADEAENASKEKEIAEEEARVEEVERVLRGDPEKAAQLDKIVELRSSLEKETKKLKEQKAASKKQVAAIKAECEGLAADLEHLSSEERNEQINNEVQGYEEQKATLVEQLRANATDAMNILRKIDQYPTRIELKQYETRIDELNEEVAWKFEETRLMFAIHNTRGEVQKTLGGEKVVFDQISEEFEKCVSMGPKKSADKRENLLEQIESVISQLGDARGKLSTKLSSEQESISSLRQQYQSLIDKQKRYFETVAKFKDRAAMIADLSEADRKAIFGGGDEEEEDDAVEI